MTTKEHLLLECPACGSDNVEELPEIETNVCGSCSLVISDVSATRDVDLDSTVFSDTPDEEEAIDEWSETVSITDNSDKHLIELLKQVEKVVSEFTILEEVEVRAGEIATEAWQSNFLHGRGKEVTAAAAVYIASRESNVTIPHRLLAESVGTTDTTVVRTYKALRNSLDIELAPVSAVEFVPYLVNELAVPEQIEFQAVSMLEEVASLVGDPVGNAAAAVYEASNNTGGSVTFRELSTATRVTKETIWRKADTLRNEL